METLNLYVMVPTGAQNWTELSLATAFVVLDVTITARLAISF